MTSHLDIQLARQSMTLPDDFSIDVTEENPLFNDNGMYSTPVQVPMEGNRHVLQNVDDPNSDLRPVSMEHTEADINVSGLPFRHGTVVIQEGEELKDQFSFNIDESTQSFSDLIGDLKCQDVPLFLDANGEPERIPVGQKVCDVTAGVQAKINYELKIKGVIGSTTKDKQLNIGYNTTFDPQTIGFSCPGVVSNYDSKNRKAYPGDIYVRVPDYATSYINVTEPYQSVGGVPAQNGWRYCNARVCYTHYGLDASKAEADVYDDNGRLVKRGTIGETTSDIQKVDEHYASNEDYGPYWVLDANRPQSGLCFYVLYFLDCLFRYLGVVFDNSALTQIEDMRRLCFFTTKCKVMADTDTVVTRLTNIDAIHNWLDKRGCGGRIEFPEPEEASIDEFTYNGVRYKVGETYPDDSYFKIDSINVSGEILSYGAEANVRTIYATNENFPEEAVSTIISSLEASFGIRFRYDYQQNKVTAYLLRDVFRRKDNKGRELTPIKLPCEVLEVNKLSEKITGVRVKYSAESDSKEQQENIRRAKRDYETDFDYVDYRDGRTKVCMPAAGQKSAYPAIAKDLKTENVTCYIDNATANAYRFKISKDVTSANVSYHRLFEVGQFKGIEVGDCSPMNKDFVKELVSDFQPMSFNDVNAYGEMKLGQTQPLLAAYVDEDMEHEFVTQKINHPIYAVDIDFYATEVLQLVESYDPTQTDDGDSPLQSVDWGLAIALMRGGGANGTTQNYAANYDGFGNSKWRQLAGEYAMSSDTMDQYGNTFDYNGGGGGDGGGERFSLKIRSWKPFLYYTDARGRTHVTSDLSLEGQPVAGVSGKVWHAPTDAAAEVMRRGLADTFLTEYIWFLLNRKKYRIHLLAEPAALIDIPNHWDNLFQIGDYLGYIDKLQYSISRADGIGEVTVDFFAI